MTKVMTKQGFPDRVYAQAADTFRASCVEKTLDYPGVLRHAPVPHLGNERNTKQHQIWAYELAFNTLKFQALLEDILIDSCFQAAQQLPDDLMALAMVMLYDLQDRKFQPREPMAGEGEEPVQDVRLVENSLFRFRTKLAASLARFRIKQDLVCINDILPTSVKEKHQRKHTLSTCAWVNTLKSSVDEVCKMLKTQGFVQALPHTRLELSVFCRDTHCPDVLLFSNQARELLDKTTLLKDHTLIIQEKSRSLAVSALRPLLDKNTDVLIAGYFSAHTVAHVGIQASVFSSHVYVCGLPADSAHSVELQATLSRTGCKNVRLLSEPFAELNERHTQLQKVRVVLLLPRCSISALADPIVHIIHEDGDRTLLQDLSQGEVSDAKLETLSQKQIQDLSHALTFPKVHSVIYCTCSVYAEENEMVVRGALRNAARKTKSRPFRIASTGWTDEERFFRLQASGTGDGCSVCVLKREEVETIQDILDRAAAKGLLNGLALPENAKKASTKEKQRANPAPPLPVSDPSLTTDSRVPTVPGDALEHTQASRSPPCLNDGSAGEHADNQASKAANQKKKKKRSRQKPRALKYSRRVKPKKRKTRSSRKKPPHDRPV